MLFKVVVWDTDSVCGTYIVEAINAVRAAGQVDDYMVDADGITKVVVTEVSPTLTNPCGVLCFIYGKEI